MDNNEKWTIGDIVKQVREEQNITLQQLSQGLCSVVTLSRIEADTREMDIMLACAIFERLGYTLDKFECCGSKEEFEQYEKRLSIRNHKENNEIAAMEKELEEYERCVGKKQSSLQEQFIKYMNGFLAYQAGKNEDARTLLEDAIALTIPEWKGDWISGTVLGLMELELLSLLTDLYEKMGRKEDAFLIRCDILKYLEKQKECKENMARLYTGIVCRIVPYLVEKKEFQKGVQYCENGIEKISAINRMYHWPDLLYWKGRCMEELLRQDKVTEQQVIMVYQEAYYIYRLFSEEEKANTLKEHLEGEYQWESIR